MTAHGAATALTKPTAMQSESVGLTTLQQVLLGCGVFSALFYAAMNVVVPLQWEGYSLAARVVSELSAIDAPTRPMWVALGVVYAVLAIAFGCGVWATARGNRPMRVVGSLIVVNTVLGFLWPPMHQREVLAAGGGTLTDTLHIVWTVAWGVLVLLTIGFAAAAFGRRFRIYSIATVVILLAFGVLTSMDSPQMEANLPTPLIGVWERINIGVYMLWIGVLAVAILRRPSIAAQRSIP
ncbi:MAG TPA: DUF998 domain-containing protein [Gemmatimonadales bacterium]|nr:DUF998 domain-containing protein [Gemmatimonadales bacterium]